MTLAEAVATVATLGGGALRHRTRLDRSVDAIATRIHVVVDAASVRLCRGRFHADSDRQRAYKGWFQQGQSDG